ncbi:hypothetical protein BJ508DRAFT_335459 [Ascobolus immersus RN42]|uniref:Uncharacterized protein n=1 Tax=Ascobolus immersus RN42 TaxID=1160509 RepID=A0A3N4HCE7_ASCIM|nr:hypothetical protein BJ508DRAFT_335459 [Ascobolus immersus RN42]
MAELTADFDDEETNELCPDLTRYNFQLKSKRHHSSPLRHEDFSNRNNPVDPSILCNAIIQGISPDRVILKRSQSRMSRVPDSVSSVQDENDNTMQNESIVESGESDAGDVSMVPWYEGAGYNKAAVDASKGRDEEFALRSVEMAKRIAADAILKLAERRCAVVLSKAEERMENEKELDPADIDAECDKIREIHEKAQNSIAQLCTYSVSVTVDDE